MLKKQREEYTIESTREKVYIHHPKYGCVARLCKVSGDFLILPCDSLFESKYDIYRDMSFKQFRFECFKRYNVEIDNKFKPEVFK